MGAILRAYCSFPFSCLTYGRVRVYVLSSVPRESISQCRLYSMTIHGIKGQYLEYQYPWRLSVEVELVWGNAGMLRPLGLRKYATRTVINFKIVLTELHNFEYGRSGLEDHASSQIQGPFSKRIPLSSSTLSCPPIPVLSVSSSSPLFTLEIFLLNM
ncbi:hypothetical protein Tco_1238619 [Tanacetum coccineum]